MNYNIFKRRTFFIVLILILATLAILIPSCVYMKNKHNSENTKPESENTGEVQSDENNKNNNNDNDNKNGTSDGLENTESNGTQNGNNDDGKGSEDPNKDNTTGNPENTESSEGEDYPEGLHIKKPENVKALYLTGWTVGSTDRLNHFVELAKKTEINSYVVDIKDDDGLVGYKSDLPAVIENKAWLIKYNIDKVIETFHDNDIYVIGRLVCFKDPVYSSKRADLAVKNLSGGLWHDNNNLTWLDPYNKESWPYLIDIAKEAVQRGFDEIQFDYIRFPNDGDKKAMSFNDKGIEKYEIINEFIAFAKKEMPNIVLSADVFGIICESPKDTEDIGQYLELIGKDIEFLSPMVYPSHYALGQIVNGVKFDKPDFEPYGVVYNSLVKAKNRISSLENYKGDIRPYLQGFTASYLRSGNYQVYGPSQIKEQIQAVYDAGFTEWIIWDPSNRYPEEAFLNN